MINQAFSSMKPYILCVSILLGLFSCKQLPVSAQITPGTPILVAHAHNDYVHKRPLAEALEQGFTSLEIDIFLHKGEIIVSHVPLFLNLKPNLRERYLEPLHQLIQSQGGKVFPNHDTQLILMIDVKTNGREMYPVLKEALAEYEDMLTIYTPDSVKRGPVKIVLSGARDGGAIETDERHYFQRDGGFDDSDSPALTPRASGVYRKVIKWRGGGDMPTEEREKLQALVQKVHSKGKKLRLFAAPNKEAVWRELLDAGVDWINVDKLKAFRIFYEQYQKEKETSP